MKLEIVALAITAFFIANTYYDGKYLGYIKKGKKYFKVASIAFAGFSAYLFLKKHPGQTHDLLSSAAGVMRRLPVDHSWYPMPTAMPVPRAREPFPTAKRSVSETKKKFIASSQDWKCKGCGDKLSAWFEIDHTVRLDRGGTNEVQNLTALCRNCHGQKTAMENM